MSPPFKITTIFMTVLFCSSLNTLAPEQTASTLSLSQEFQLNFIRQEINKYPDLFINDWTTNSSVQLIVESAELAIQNSSESTKPIMKQRIINLFRKIGITIAFTQEDLIIKIDQPNQKIRFHFNDNTHHTHIKKQRHIQQQKPQKNKEPQKIKGARRTLRRIKKKLADQEKAAREQELAEIRRKAALSDRTTDRRFIKPHETIDSIEFWRNRLMQQRIQQEQHTIFTRDHAHDALEEHEIIEKPY